MYEWEFARNDMRLRDLHGKDARREITIAAVADDEDAMSQLLHALNDFVERRVRCPFEYVVVHEFRDALVNHLELDQAMTWMRLPGVADARRS